MPRQKKTRFPEPPRESKQSKEARMWLKDALIALDEYDHEGAVRRTLWALECLALRPGKR